MQNRRKRKIHLHPSSFPFALASFVDGGQLTNKYIRYNLPRVNSKFHSDQLLQISDNNLDYRLQAEHFSTKSKQAHKKKYVLLLRRWRAPHHDRIALLLRTLLKPYPPVAIRTNENVLLSRKAPVATSKILCVWKQTVCRPPHSASCLTVPDSKSVSLAKKLRSRHHFSRIPYTASHFAYLHKNNKKTERKKKIQKKRNNNIYTTNDIEQYPPSHSFATSATVA